MIWTNILKNKDLGRPFLNVWLKQGNKYTHFICFMLIILYLYMNMLLVLVWFVLHLYLFSILVYVIWKL